MKIAIFRPRWAKNNTAFEVQARLYVYLRKKYGLEITVFADKENRFQYEGLNVVDIERGAPRSLFSRFKQSTHRSEANYPQWKILNGYDVIETSDPTLYEYAWTAFKAARKFGSRLVCGSSVGGPLSTRRVELEAQSRNGSKARPLTPTSKLAMPPVPAVVTYSVDRSGPPKQQLLG